MVLMKRLPEDFYKDKKVIVIGPSEGAPKEVEQVNLDDYDYVIRLNDHFYDSDKHGLGKRTDIIYHSLLSGQYNKDHLTYLIKHNIKLIARYCSPNKKIDGYLRMCGDETPDWYLFNEGRAKRCPIVLKCCPSTGILAIYDALTDGAKEVAALGFDFYETFYTERPIETMKPKSISRIINGNHRPATQLRNFTKWAMCNRRFNPIGRFKELFEREKMIMSEEKLFLKNRVQDAARASLNLELTSAYEFAEKIFELRKSGKKAIFMGNGASYTIANHAALDYMSQLGIQTLCAADQAVLTAFANDFGYDHALERYCKINYKKGDILVCVSSSGNSPNVVNAAKWVKAQGGTVVTFTGFEQDNKLSEIASSNFWVNSKVYNIVESVHNLWLAMICDLMIEWMGDGVGTHGINI